MIELLLLLATISGPTLESDTQIAVPGRLNEIRVKLDPPAGYEVAFQRWHVINGEADGRAYDNNQVFVYTGKAGSMSSVLWEVVFVSWEEKKFITKSRVYLLKFSGVPPPNDPVDPKPEPNKAIKQAVYIYERTEHSPPRSLQAGLVELNRRGIMASLLDDDIFSGDGTIPKQYRKVMAKAKEVGLPVLVIEYNDGRAVAFKDVKTKEEILEAAGED